MTIQTNIPPDRQNRPAERAERKSDLVCRIKYNNTLPDVPFDPKFIQYPFETSRFISYHPTTLERNYKYEVLTEHDIGVSIDLVDKDIFNVDPNAVLAPADERLLEEDILTPQDSKRSRHHARSVSWLRRTEYISTEQTRFQPQTMDKVEAKVGYSIRKNFKEDTVYLDRDGQVEAIQKTFEEAVAPIEHHYSKPNVTVVESFYMFPDFEAWKYPHAQVVFDSDPAPAGRSVPAQIEEMSQAMIRGVMDESGEQFVAYFLPTEETIGKRRNDQENKIDYEDDQEYDYKMAREYNWNVKNKASKGYEENYFFIVRSDGIFYNELETRVRLSKRRQKPGQAPSNTRLVVRHRPVNELEHRMQRYRERQLEPAGEEEEEEEDPLMSLQQENIKISRTGVSNYSDEEYQSGSEREDSDRRSDAGSDRSNTKRRQSGSDGEGRKSRSRSRSSGSARSKHSRSRSASVNSKKSRSGSRGSSRSRSRSGSPASASSNKNRSRSHSSASKGSRSRSASRESKSNSRSASPASNKSGSASPSNRSGSGSPAGKRRDSNAKSASASPGDHSRSASAESARSNSSAASKSKSRSASESD